MKKKRVIETSSSSLFSNKMDDDEKLVLKYLIAFCKILPIIVQNWKSALQDSVKPLQSLSNLGEQQRHVKR